MANQTINMNQLEDSLARELQKRKFENEARQREMDKILNESEEIKELRHKFKVAQLNKERSAQIYENQLRRLDQLRQESLIEDSILQKRQDEIRAEYNKDCHLGNLRQEQKQVLLLQMQEKLQAAQEAHAQYLRERDQVDAVVNKILNEDQKAMEDRKQKTAQNLQAMYNALREKEEKIYQMKQQEKIENQAYLDFIKAKDQQAQGLKAKKAAEDAIKEAIFKKISDEEKERQRKQEEFENLKTELYFAQYEENERLKGLAEEKKRQDTKKILMQAKDDALAFKAEQLQKEKQMEIDFRNQMLKKFADDEKLDQMTNQKRRMREQEHKREVEKLWNQKIQVFQQEKEAEQREIQKQKYLQEQKEILINQEKQKLIEQFTQNFDGFLPKNVGYTQKPIKNTNQTNFKLA